MQLEIWVCVSSRQNASHGYVLRSFLLLSVLGYESCAVTIYLKCEMLKMAYDKKFISNHVVFLRMVFMRPKI